MTVADGEAREQNGVVVVDSLRAESVVIASDAVPAEEAVTAGAYPAEEILAGGDGGEGDAGVESEVGAEARVVAEDALRGLAGDQGADGVGAVYDGVG